MSECEHQAIGYRKDGVLEWDGTLGCIQCGARPMSPAKCTHKHWTFNEHGRRCTCGEWMVDFGD